MNFSLKSSVLASIIAVVLTGSTKSASAEGSNNLRGQRVLIQDLDQLSHGFVDPSVSHTGVADHVYFGDEVADEVVSSNEAGEEVILDAGGCNSTHPYCETVNECTDKKCIDLDPLSHCDCVGNTCNTPGEKKKTCDVGNKVFCGPHVTGDPRLFGPPLWKFLHTISIHYDPKGNAAQIQKCEHFIDAFAPMIPCMHCAWHYNQFLLGSKNPPEKRLDKNDNEWDWVNNGSPCKDKKTLQHFLVDAHNNVGQHVQVDHDTGETRPKFVVKDLDKLYGNVFDPIVNRFVSSDEPEFFNPILLEAINLIAMSHGTLLFFNHTYEPLPSIKYACETFLTHLPFMIPNHPQSVITKARAKKACDSHSAMLTWVAEFEGDIIDDRKSSVLSLEDRKKRYATRTGCLHNSDWLTFPMRRAITKDVLHQQDICLGDLFSETRKSTSCLQPWIPAVMKNVPSP